jgi:hypothetical protein
VTTVAEIIRVRSVTTQRRFSQRDPGEAQSKVIETVTVRSIRSDRLDVSVLRDLVAALDAAGVPGGALVEAERSQVGHLVELRVMRVEVPIGGSTRAVRSARRKVTDDVLRDVAEVYRREIGKNPTEAVADHLGVAMRTAGLYVRRARDAGFLGEALRGKAGEL